MPHCGIFCDAIFPQPLELSAASSASPNTPSKSSTREVRIMLLQAYFYGFPLQPRRKPEIQTPSTKTYSIRTPRSPFDKIASDTQSCSNNQELESTSQSESNCDLKTQLREFHITGARNHPDPSALKMTSDCVSQRIAMTEGLRQPLSPLGLNSTSLPLLDATLTI